MPNHFWLVLPPYILQPENPLHLRDRCAEKVKSLKKKLLQFGTNFFDTCHWAFPCQFFRLFRGKNLYFSSFSTRLLLRGEGRGSNSGRKKKCYNLLPEIHWTSLVQIFEKEFNLIYIPSLCKKFTHKTQTPPGEFFRFSNPVEFLSDFFLNRTNKLQRSLFKFASRFSFNTSSSSWTSFMPGEISNLIHKIGEMQSDLFEENW